MGRSRMISRLKDESATLTGEDDSPPRVDLERSLANPISAGHPNTRPQPPSVGPSPAVPIRAYGFTEASLRRAEGCQMSFAERDQGASTNKALSSLSLAGQPLPENLGTPRSDLRGLRVHKLTVVSYAVPASMAASKWERCNGSRWLCQCECGGAKIVGAKTLKKGKIKSCGCLANNGAKLKSKLPSGYGNFYRQYRKCAYDRKLDFLISEKQFYSIVLQDCFYCGSPPQQRSTTSRTFKASGVDRMNNDEGYVLSNCVPCCSICNMAKGQSTVQEYAKWMDRLIDRRLQMRGGL